MRKSCCDAKTTTSLAQGKRGVRHLTSQLLIPITLVVVVGVAQIMFAVGVLTEGRSTSWFLTITVVGTLLNMGIIVYTASSTIRAGECANGNEEPDYSSSKISLSDFQFVTGTRSMRSMTIKSTALCFFSSFRPSCCSSATDSIGVSWSRGGAGGGGEAPLEAPSAPLTYNFCRHRPVRRSGQNCRIP